MKRISKRTVKTKQKLIDQSQQTHDRMNQSEFKGKKAVQSKQPAKMRENTHRLV